MKIDLHLHTKVSKSGDPSTREVTAEVFKKELKRCEIKVAAITNHNEFDMEQFDNFVSVVDGSFLLWPGIEFDVKNLCDEGEILNNGHVLVISDVVDKTIFKHKVTKLIAGRTPDNVVIDIDELCDTFKDLKVLVIVHYKKKNYLNNQSIEMLKSKISSDNLLLLEPSNLRSARILVKENKRIIVGSDVRNWNNYEKESLNRVPDTKFEIDSFSKFFNVLNRDTTTINSIFDDYPTTLLENVKMPEGDKVSLKLYRDLNVIYGDKGTGKTFLLKGIAKTLRSKGYSKAKVINPSQQNLKEKYNLTGKTATKEFANDVYLNCEEEVKRLKNHNTIDVTPTSNYVSYFKSKKTESNADKIKLNELQEIVYVTDVELFDSMKSVTTILTNNKTELDRQDGYNVIYTLDERKKITEFFDWMILKAKNASIDKFKDIKSLELVNTLISFYQKEMGEITSNTEAPNSTGFYEYASNKLKLRKDLIKICKNLLLKSNTDSDEIGELNTKGKIFYSEDILFSEKDIVGYKSFKSLTKENIFKIREKLNEIYNSIFETQLYSKIDSMKEVDSENKFNSLDDLLIFKKSFVLEDGSSYLPSDGESAIITLRNALNEDMEFYIIDEPEKSMGNLIINREIMPELNKIIKRGKHVIISTHDANLAVRTMPVQTVYRVHNNGKYSTYVGNLFSDILVEKISQKTLSWNKTSLNIFEGGEKAFKEREYIYDFEGM